MCFRPTKECELREVKRVLARVLCRDVPRCLAVRDGQFLLCSFGNILSIAMSSRPGSRLGGAPTSQLRKTLRK